MFRRSISPISRVEEHTKEGISTKQAAWLIIRGLNAPVVLSLGKEPPLPIG
jgi:hypothetical protein